MLHRGASTRTSKQGKFLRRLYVNIIRRLARPGFTNDRVRLGVRESIACVGSVSSRGSSRKLGQDQKKK